MKTILKAHLLAAVLSYLSKFTTDAICHTFQMVGVETISVLHILTVINLWSCIIAILFCISFVLLYNCVSMKNDWPSTYDLNVSLYNHVSQAVLKASLLEDKKCNQTKESGCFSLKGSGLQDYHYISIYLIVVTI